MWAHIASRLTVVSEEVSECGHRLTVVCEEISECGQRLLLDQL